MKKMTKMLATVLMTILIATALICTLTACDSNPNGEKIDPNRTQLYVFNFDGGYGTDWLNAVKTRYEELHKDDVWEEGKKGVQIFITPKKENATANVDKILSNREEVYFTEYVQYYEFLSKGILGDITEAVTGDLESYGDPTGTTIESKLTDEQKAYYGVAEGSQTKYYGIPHYSGYYGIIYNVDVFDAKGYYFVDGYDKNNIMDLTDYFIYNPDDKRSAGPDGLYDTADDGLPATYEEFFLLCDYIRGSGQTPLVWSGHDYTGYLQNLAHSLQIDHDGKDQSMLTYNLGINATVNQATSLGTVVDGEFVLDTTPTTITTSNATQLFRQEGRYQALSFLEKLIDSAQYQYKDVFNSAFSHMNAQTEFLMSGNDGVTNQIAMLVDGIWWEAEATTTFNNMVDQKGDEFSKMNRNFAFMPLPKATADDVGQATLYDHIYSMCFMKASIEDWKKPLAYDFIKFVNSNESLVEFTQITNTPKALNYTMTDAQLALMTDFGRSVLQLKNASQIVYPFATNSIYINNQSKFTTGSLFTANVKGIKYDNLALAFHEDPDMTAAEYFAGMKAFYDQDWASMLG